MHPQHPWMMRVNAEEVQREIERNMRLRQARAAARRERQGLVSAVRHSMGQALIAMGSRIQPPVRSARESESGLELELAR